MTKLAATAETFMWKNAASLPATASGLHLVLFTTFFYSVHTHYTVWVTAVFPVQNDLSCLSLTEVQQSTEQVLA